MGGEVNAKMLTARIRKERRSAGASSFVLDVSIEVSPGTYCSILSAELVFPCRSGEPLTFFRPWHYFRT